MEENLPVDIIQGVDPGHTRPRPPKEFSSHDLRCIDKARLYAMEAHKAQLDDDGNPYYWHLQDVHEILWSLTDDVPLLIAAYLHDTIEDTSVTFEDLVADFGLEVANLVMEVTHEGQKDSYGYYFPRLRTRRGIMLKFADRLSNLNRIQKWPHGRRQQYLRKSQFWRSSGPDAHKTNPVTADIPEATLG